MQLIPDDIDFAAYMNDQEVHAVRPASDWLQDTIDAFYAPSDASAVPTMLWEKTREKVRFRPGEVSLWAGINGHGKSMFLSQVELDLCYQAERVMVASFEMKPVKQMHRMSRQAYGGREPSISFLQEFHRWTDGRLWLYDHVGAVEWRKVIAVMRYAIHHFGITHFVIDSLMKCVKGEDDYNAQKDFVNELSVGCLRCECRAPRSGIALWPSTAYPGAKHIGLSMWHCKRVRKASVIRKILRKIQDCMALIILNSMPDEFR